MLVAIVAIGFTSCSTDGEPEVDVRDQAVGTYSGTMTYYILEEDGDLVSYESLELEPSESDINNVQVSKDEANDGSIKITSGGDVIYGIKIEEAGNGFTFDIESQVYEGMTITGYNCIDLGGIKYHGAFSSETDELSWGCKVDIDDAGFDKETIEYLESLGYEAMVMDFELDKI